MSDVFEMLAVPHTPTGPYEAARSLLEQRAAFQDLVTPERLPKLISSLQTCIADDPGSVARRIPQLVAQWEEEYYPVREDDRWRRLKLVLACAVAAANRKRSGEPYSAGWIERMPNPIGPEDPGALLELVQTCDYARPDWLAGCERTLLSHQPVHKVDVAFAYAGDVPASRTEPHHLDAGGPHPSPRDPDTEPDGGLAVLTLEVFTPGHGRLFHHPEDVLTAAFDGRFLRSLRAAWYIASRHLLGAEQPGFDGRWRVSAYGGWGAVDGIGGASASGAALRGWLHALQRRWPDEQVIVIAEVSDQQRHNGSTRRVLGDVSTDSIKSKVGAICGARAFDTIVVAGEKTAAEVRDELEVRGIGRHEIDLVDLS